MSKESSGTPRRRKALDGLKPFNQGAGLISGQQNWVRLSHNESPYGPAPEAQQAYINVANSIGIYGDGRQAALRAALSTTHSCSVEEIICGNGSDELISLLLRAYLDVGDEIVLSENGFVMTTTHATVAGANIVRASENNRTIDPEAIVAALSPQTRVVSICNPNTPAGTFLDQSTLKGLIDSVPSHIIVHVDEAYAEYAALELSYSSALGLLAETPNLVVTRTFSKAYGLAGLRIGWLVANQSVIETIDRFRTPFNANTAALAAATVAVECQDWLAKVVSDNYTVREKFVSALAPLDVEVIPSATNFVLLCFPIGSGKSGSEAYKVLRSEGYLTGPTTADDVYLRISIGTADQMEEVVRILVNYLDAPSL